ncbi:MAG: UbiA family prenyltransferase [Pseudomonadota bacterium]
MPEPVLVVDMDGTLLRNDSLHEALARLAAEQPLGLIPAALSLTGGKAAFKRKVADMVLAEASEMAYRPEVRAKIDEARAEGRRVALVSAADQRQVAAVAGHIGGFDEAIGTGADGTDGNLSGAGKAALLKARYTDGFDYIGDAPVDRAVWEAARQAYVAGGSAGALRAAGPKAVALDGETPARFALLKAMRPHQWLKNALIFVPVLASQQFAALPQAIFAFIAFSLIASSVYIANDLIDLKADRAHPRKRKRPFAAADVSLAKGAMLGGGLILGGAVFAAALLPAAFLAILFLYLALTLGYSLRLKRMMIVDIWTLAGLYTVRIFAGAVATGVVVSPWLLTFSMFLFLCLAAIKRQAELADLAKRGQDVSAGRGYVAGDLPVLRIIAVASGYAAVLVFALYINSPAVALVYAAPVYLWAVCPILLFWVSHIVMATHRGLMEDDPLIFAIRDRTSLACGAASVLVFALASLTA